MDEWNIVQKNKVREGKQQSSDRRQQSKPKSDSAYVV
jgi:hypothetical protein